MKRICLLAALALVLTSATPTYAKNWGGKRDRGNTSSWNLPNFDNWDFPDIDWDDFQWPDFSDEDWCDKDWDWCDKLDDWDWCDDDENPVPEPATAGLALMSLGALGVATRRRR